MYFPHTLGKILINSSLHTRQIAFVKIADSNYLFAKIVVINKYKIGNFDKEISYEFNKLILALKSYITYIEKYNQDFFNDILCVFYFISYICRHLLRYVF